MIKALFIIFIASTLVAKISINVRSPFNWAVKVERPLTGLGCALFLIGIVCIQLSFNANYALQSNIQRLLLLCGTAFCLLGLSTLYQEINSKLSKYKFYILEKHHLVIVGAKETREDGWILYDVIDNPENHRLYHEHDYINGDRIFKSPDLYEISAEYNGLKKELDQRLAEKRHAHHA